MSSTGILSVSGVEIAVAVLDSMRSVFARFGAVVDGLKNASSVRFAIVEWEDLGYWQLELRQLRATWRISRVMSFSIPIYAFRSGLAHIL